MSRSSRTLSLLRGLVSLSSKPNSLLSTTQNHVLSRGFFPLTSQAHPFSSSHLNKPSAQQTITSPPPSSNDDVDLPSDVSTEELKQRIDKYMAGDGEAIPSIFEAILARKLSGKHEDTDDELMKQFQSETPRNDEKVESDIDFFDSDEDFSESDEEEDEDSD